MGRVWMWFWLSGKRCFYRRSFFIILLALPLGAFWIRGREEEGPAKIRIALWAPGGQEEEGAVPGQEPLEQLLIKDLAGRQGQDGLFQFYACESEGQLKDDVASRRAECGYVLASRLREKLNQGDFKRSIRVFSAPSTVAARLSTETVFAALIALYDQELFREYMQSAAGIGPALADQAYGQWKGSKSTFHFTYETVGGPGPFGGAPDQSAVFTVRGIVAVYVFAIGLYGAAMSLADEKRGLFRAIPYGRRIMCRLAAMAAPSALAALSGLAALWAGKCLGAWPKEVAAMAGYVAAVTLFSWGVRAVCRHEAVACCLIPFFLVGSFLFCPVFFDISRYIPEFGVSEKLFLPGYYIRASAGFFLP